jgi:hypothetical protein
VAARRPTAKTAKVCAPTYLSDLQRYADALAGASATRSRRLRALKSLLSFAAKMGYLPFNVAPPRGPQARSRSWRSGFLSEPQVFALLEAVEDRPRDRVDPSPL